MLHDLVEANISVRAFESGSDVGGVWNWNRYPGARTDSESWYYCYRFSSELYDDWNWSQRYPDQPEMLAYFRHVADRFDLRRHISFNTRVASAIWDEETAVWTLTTEHGEVVRCRWFISASGALSKAYLPAVPGLETFQGEWYQTAAWPQDHQPDFTGKRVAVVGTGASGVQVVPVVALTAEQVTVFQRTPNYVIPARNRALRPEELAEFRADFAGVWERARQHYYGMDLPMAEQGYAEMSPEDARRALERAWEIGGFRFLFDTFSDLWFLGDANDIASEFVREKIRAIVKDPVTAELLCPKYPLAAKRPPCGHQYYETFNRDNVSLVDVSGNPITEITPTGLRTGATEFEADIIIFATGFDAITGAASGIDVRGRGGLQLADAWSDIPRNFVGLAVDGFPNMFTIAGPLGPNANGPTFVEFQAEFIMAALKHSEENDLVSLEARPEAVDGWVDLVGQVIEGTVLTKAAEANSWFVGANIPGRKPRVLAWFGGAGPYFDQLDNEVASGFASFSSRSVTSLAGAPSDSEFAASH